MATCEKLDRGLPVERISRAIPERKAALRSAQKATPPMKLPHLSLRWLQNLSAGPVQGQGAPQLERCCCIRRLRYGKGVRAAWSGGLRSDGLGRCTGGQAHHTRLDTALRPRGSHRHRRRWPAQPRIDRGAGVWHSGRVGHRRCHQTHSERANDYRGWERRNGYSREKWGIGAISHNNTICGYPSLTRTHLLCSSHCKTSACLVSHLRNGFGTSIHLLSGIYFTLGSKVLAFTRFRAASTC